jgi:protein ImuB
MYAALHLPDLALEVLRRSNPSLAAHPLALVDPPARPAPAPSRGGQPRSPGSPRRGGGLVAECSREAAAAGVAPGMGVARALARCPDLVVAERDAAAEAAAGTALVDFGRSLSPDVEAVAPATLLLDVFAVAACRQDPADWRTRVLARPFEFPFRLALGPTPDLAHLSVTAGAHLWEASVGMLWPLASLTPLGLPPALLERWHAWGLRTLGDLAALGAGGVAARQGAEAARWQQIITGTAHRPLRLCREALNFAEAVELDERIESLEPLLFLLNRMLGTLESRLESAQRVAITLAMELTFEDGERHAKELRIAEPTRAREVLLGILRTYLETLSAPAAVVAISLQLEPSLPGEAQADLFNRGLREVNRFFETLGRIEGLVGPGNVGVPVPANTHEPDRFSLLPYGAKLPPPQREPAAIPLRRFRPPLGVRVACVEGAPMALLTGAYAGRIERSRGPFLLSGQWWEPAACWRRAEWDVESAGRLLRLARLPANHWQLEGIYG